MLSALYNRDILRLAASIPHLGAMESADGAAERRAPVCGSEARAAVKLDAAGRIAALGQEVSACALGQAAAALMGAAAIGADAAALRRARGSLAAWLEGDRDDPGDWPGLAVFAAARDVPARHGAILLPFDAALAAIEEALARRS